MNERQTGAALKNIFTQLYAAYGPQHWWPAETPFEVMVGAILTQSAAWTNVEKAIRNLKSAGAFSPQTLRSLPESELGQLVRASGYYNAKARKLKSLVSWLEKYGDNLERAFIKDTDALRRELLSVHGIGEETADSILLYAAGRPVFVIDAYTRRIASRLGFTVAHESYSAYQALFMDNLPHDAPYFNEYHALLVCLGKNACRKKPRCKQCCLKGMCAFQLQRSLGSAKL